MMRKYAGIGDAGQSWLAGQVTSDSLAKEASAILLILHTLFAGVLRFRSAQERGYSVRRRRRSSCMNFDTVSPGGLPIARRLRAWGESRTAHWRMPAFLAKTSASVPVMPQPGIVSPSRVSTAPRRRDHSDRCRCRVAL